ncbi:23761_t:CDS:2, partial [Racocetra persica]
DSCHLSPTKPKILVEYYPAYKLNNLKPGINFNISSSIDYLNYIAYGPNDLVNNAANNDAGGDPLKFFNSSKFNELSNYKANKNLKFKIDIDYPFKFPCNPSIGFDETDFSNFLNAISAQLGNNKNLTITAGQYPIKSINSNIISFINLQIESNNWTSIDRSKLVLGVEFGGIVEIVTSKNIISDIENQTLHLANVSNLSFPFPTETIPDQCSISSYAYWPWKDLSSQLSSPFCPTNLTSSSQNWTYGFINNAKQPYLYRQDPSSKYYYVAFYEDYQSLNAKLDYIKNNNLAGIAIADITKDSQLINFISGNQTNNTGGNEPSSPDIAAIVGGRIGSIIFVGTLVAVGIVLYRRKHRAKTSNPLIDTNNQTCSDTNPQIYSDINRQLILSVLLPTTQDLVKISPFSNIVTGQYNQNNTFVSDLINIVAENSFDGIDIDYPNKFPCYPAQGTNISANQQLTTDNLNSVFIPFLNDLSSQLRKSNGSKILTVTAGQYPISGLNSSNSGIINFVNIQ